LADQRDGGEKKRTVRTVTVRRARSPEGRIEKVRGAWRSASEHRPRKAGEISGRVLFRGGRGVHLTFDVVR